MLRKLLLLLCLNAWCAVSVYGAEPTTPASNLAAGTITCKTVQLTWTSGNGAWRIVLMKEASAVNATPTDNISYLSNGAFGTGQEIGTGNFVVFNNITNNCTVTGLKPNTQYYVTVFEHDGAGPDYLTSKSATVSFKTNNLVMGFSYKGTKDSCEKSNKITFTNTSTATFGWIKYTWIFGDGTQDTGVNITHTYNKGGNFTVNLVASPALGCVDIATSAKSIFIVPRPVSKPFEKMRILCSVLRDTFSNLTTIPSWQKSPNVHTYVLGTLRTTIAPRFPIRVNLMPNRANTASITRVKRCTITFQPVVQTQRTCG